LAFSRYPSMTDYVTCKTKLFSHKMADGSYIKGGPASAAWNPGMDETYEIITQIVQDVLTVFGNVEYIHLGGDEVMKDTCWGPDPYV